MDRKAQQENCGEHRTNPVAGDVDEAVQRKQHCRDQRGKPVAWIRPLWTRKYPPNQKGKTGDNKNDRDPTEFCPKPKPIALRMKRALVVEGCGAEGREDGFKVAQANSNPGRIPKQLKNVRKNFPSKVR